MSDQSARKFRREREAHYALEREKDAERVQARLKGFKPATKAEMTSMILGVPQTPIDVKPTRRVRRSMRGR